MGAGAGAMKQNQVAAERPSSTSHNHERAVSMRQKKMSHLEKTRLVQTVETFTKLVYLNVDSTISLGNFLGNETGAEVFSKFLEREHAEHFVKLYTDLEKCRTVGNAARMEWALTNYLEAFPRSGASSGVSVEARVEVAQKETIEELAKNMFPRFLCSTEYQKWRAAERSAYSAMFLRGSVCISEDNADNVSLNREGSGRSLSFSSTDGGKDGEDNSIFNSIDMQEVNKIVNTDSWLTTLLARADSLPIGMTMLSARSDRKGYPLVYVNRFYEERSGFDKAEMLGHRWNFLVGTEVDNATMQTVYKAVKYAKQLNVLVNSPRKNGTTYPSVMCLKPIFDAQGSYSYMLGLHLVLDDDSPEKVDAYMQLADTLTLVLPQVLKHSGFEEE